MTNNNQAWPLYDCTKQVRALRIKALSEPTPNDLHIKMVTASFFEEGYPDLELLPVFMDKHEPVVGGYLVQYLNSAGEVEYTSFSPFQPFQSYVPVDPTAKSNAEREERQLMMEFVRQRPEQLRNTMIAHLIGKIFFYGDFKVETKAEAELDALLREGGFRYENEADLMTAVDRIENSHDSFEARMKARAREAAPVFTNTLDEGPPWEQTIQPLRNVSDAGFLRGAIVHLWSIIAQLEKVGDPKVGSEFDQIIRQRSQHLASDGKELFVVQK